MSFLACLAIVSQVALVAVFAALSLSGDGLGIVWALTLAFAVPLVLLTLPAALLLHARHVRSAALLAGAALVVSAGLWRFA